MRTSLIHLISLGLVFVIERDWVKAPLFEGIKIEKETG